MLFLNPLTAMRYGLADVTDLGNSARKEEVILKLWALGSDWTNDTLRSQLASRLFCLRGVLLMSPLLVRRIFKYHGFS